MNQLAIPFQRETKVPSKTSQCGRLLRHLQQHDSITTMEAYDLYGITCCGQRLSDLRRMGWPVKSDPFKTPGGAIVAKYYLARLA